MAAISIEIEGLDRIASVLSRRRIQGAIRNGIRKSTTKIAKYMRPIVKRAVPYRTGRMRRGMRVRRKILGPLSAGVEVVSRDSKARGGRYVFYYFILEAKYGFVARAFRDNRDEISDIVRGEIRAELNKLFGG